MVATALATEPSKAGASLAAVLPDAEMKAAAASGVAIALI